MQRTRHHPPPCRPLGAFNQILLQPKPCKLCQVAIGQRLGFQLRLEVVVVHDLQVRLRPSTTTSAVTFALSRNNCGNSIRPCASISVIWP